MTPELLGDNAQWRDAPEYLSTATVYDVPAKDRPRDGLEHKVQFTVNESGVLVLAASSTPDGNALDEWYATRSTPKQLEKEGWIRFGTIRRVGSNKREDEFLLYRRVVKVACSPFSDPRGMRVSAAHEGRGETQCRRSDGSVTVPSRS